MNVGTLEVQMSANIARLTSDMAAARRTVEDGVSGISRAADAAKAALASLGLGAGLAQIIQMSDQYTKFTAQLKLATQSTRHDCAGRPERDRRVVCAHRQWHARARRLAGKGCGHH
jgi:hypothetical protein